MGNEFLANNLIIGEDIVILLCKQSIIYKIAFLKRIMSSFYKLLLSIFIICYYSKLILFTNFRLFYF